MSEWYYIIHPDTQERYAVLPENFKHFEALGYKIESDENGEAVDHPAQVKMPAGHVTGTPQGEAANQPDTEQPEQDAKAQRAARGMAGKKVSLDDAR